MLLMFDRPAEIPRREDMLDKLIVIFDVLYTKEYAPKDNRKEQEKYDLTVIAHLRPVHCERHRKGACNKYGGIERAPPNAENIAPFSKRIEIEMPVERVCEEHATEEHDLRQQEPPHAERACFALLLHALEMMHEPRMM